MNLFSKSLVLRFYIENIHPNEELINVTPTWRRDTQRRRPFEGSFQLEVL